MVDKIQSREEVLLKSLLRFYIQDDQHLNILSAVSKQKTIISLREMDYTVTNYSDNNKVIYKLKNGATFNMYLDYKCQLRGYSKKCFDPFCRRQRIFIDYETKTPIYLEDSEINDYKLSDDGIVTTIGQLNFFRWAITNEVVDFCFNNKESIDNEMELTDKKKLAKNQLSKDKGKDIPFAKIVDKDINIPIAKIAPHEDDAIKVIIQFS